MYNEVAMLQMNRGRFNTDTERRHKHHIKLIQQHLYNSNGTFAKYRSLKYSFRRSTCDVTTTQNPSISSLLTIMEEELTVCGIITFGSK